LQLLGNVRAFLANLRVTLPLQTQDTAPCKLLRNLPADPHCSQSAIHSLLADAEEIADLGSWEHDCSTGLETWSANLCRMLGRLPSSDPVSETRFWDLVNPEDLEPSRKIISLAMKERRAYEYRVRVRIPGNNERVFVTRAKPILGVNGRVVKRVGIDQDITRAVEFEAMLAKSEKKYRDLVESSEDLICTHSLDGVVLSLNERPARVLGFDPRLVIGRQIPDMLLPEYRERYPEYVEKLRRDGRASGLVAVRTRSGEKRIWEYQNTVRRTSSGEPIVQGSARDVTERVGVERQLRESERKLRALVGSDDEVVFEMDADGRYINVWCQNDALLTLPKDQIIGRTIRDVLGDDASRMYLEIIGRVLASGKGEYVEYPFELQGSHRRMLARITTVPSSGTRPKTLCVLVRDITDRHISEQEVKRQKELLQKILDTAPIMFSVVGSDGCYKFSNKEWDKTFGGLTSRGEFREPARLSPFYPYSCDLESALRSVPVTDGEWQETKFVSSSGNIDIASTRVQMSDLSILAIDQDITERNVYFQKLAESERLAKRRLAELNQIYDTAPVGLCFVDPELRYVRVNNVLAEMNGLPATEHIGKTVRQVLGNLADKIEPLYAQIFNSHTEIRNVEICGPKPGSTTAEGFWNVSFFPLTDDRDILIGCNVVVADITEKKLI
jgi:PAS domain S-box-containing protein